MTRKRKKNKKRKRQVPKQRFPAYLSKVKFWKKKKIRNRISQILNFRAAEQVMGKRCSYARFKSRERETKRGIFFSFLSRDEITVCRLRALKKKSLGIVLFKVYMPSQEYLHRLNWFEIVPSCFSLLTLIALNSHALAQPQGIETAENRFLYLWENHVGRWKTLSRKRDVE